MSDLGTFVSDTQSKLELSKDDAGHLSGTLTIVTPPPRRHYEASVNGTVKTIGDQMILSFEAVSAELGALYGWSGYIAPDVSGNLVAAGSMVQTPVPGGQPTLVDIGEQTFVRQD